MPETTRSKRSVGSNPNLVRTAGVMTVVNRIANTIEDVITNRGKRYL